MGDCLQVFHQAMQANSAWPSVLGLVQRVLAKLLQPELLVYGHNGEKVLAVTESGHLNPFVPSVPQMEHLI